MNLLAPASATDPARVAATIGACGPAGVRLAQLIALRADLFDRRWRSALQLRRPTTAVEIGAARERIRNELGKPIEAIFSNHVVYPTASNPLQCAFRGILPGGREAMMRVSLPEQAPTREQMRRALECAEAAMRDLPDRDWAIESLRADLIRWTAADLDLAAQRRSLQALREAVLPRSGVIVAETLDPLCAAHVLTLATLPAVPVSQASAALSGARGDGSDSTASRIAEQLIRAALEQVLVVRRVPVEPRLDQLAVLAGDRIVRIDIGPAELLSPALERNLHRYARALLADDPAVIAAHILELASPGPSADVGAFERRVAAAYRRRRGRRARPTRGLPASEWVQDVAEAAGETGIRLPPDLLALGRWVAAASEAAAQAWPEVPVRRVASSYLAQREIEALFELPRSDEAARDVLSVVELVEAMPDRLDRLLSDLNNEHLRLRVEEHKAPAERRFRADQVRLICAALLWVGLAVLLLATRGAATGPAQTIVTAGLWLAAAANAVWVAAMWRRLP